MAATGSGNATFWGRERVQRRFLSAFMVLFLFISHIGRTIVVGVLCNCNNSLIRLAISSLACRNNLISDAVNIRGVEQVTCFRLCKAVKPEAEALLPPVFKAASTINPVYGAG